MAKELSAIATVLAELLTGAHAPAGTVLLSLDGELATIELAGGHARLVDPRTADLREPVMIAQGSASGLRALIDGRFDEAVESGTLSVRANRRFLQHLAAPKRSTALDVRCAG